VEGDLAGRVSPLDLRFANARVGVAGHWPQPKKGEAWRPHAGKLLEDLPNRIRDVLGTHGGR